MKKITVLLALGLSLTLLLSACKKEEETTSATSDSTAASTSGVSSASDSMSSASAPATSGVSTAASGVSTAASGGSVAAPASAASGAVATPAASGITAPPAPVVNMGGIYNTSDTERYPDDRSPYLELSDKGGFVLHFNLGDGRLAVMTGTYENTGGSLQMDVMYCDSDDFLGQDATTFSFSQDGSNGLVYGGAPLGMTRSGDVFAREGGAMGGSGGVSGKNVYVLEPGRILEGGLPPAASTATDAAPPTATASVAPASMSASGAAPAVSTSSAASKT